MDYEYLIRFSKNIAKDKFFYIFINIKSISYGKLYLIIFFNFSIYKTELKLFLLLDNSFDFYIFPYVSFALY